MKSVWPVFYSFDPEMVLHFHFTFKPFSGHAQKRERAREKRELSHQNSHQSSHSHRSSSLQVMPSSPHLLSLTVVWTPSQMKTHGEFSFHGWPFYTSNPHTLPHPTSNPHTSPIHTPHLTSPYPTSDPHTSPIHIPSNSDMPKSKTHPPDLPLGSDLSIIYIFI